MRPLQGNGRGQARRLWVITLMLSIFTGSCRSVGEEALLRLTAIPVLTGMTAEVLHGAAVLGGLLLLSLGSRIYRFVVALPGFLLGAILVSSLAQHFDFEPAYEWIGLAIGGGLGAWLTLVVHDAAVFLVGASGGAFLAYSLWDLIAEREPPVWLLVVSGVLFGALLLAMVQARRILVSSSIGATMLGWGLGAGLLVTLSAAVLGVILQTVLLRRMKSPGATL